MIAVDPGDVETSGDRFSAAGLRAPIPVGTVAADPPRGRSAGMRSSEWVGSTGSASRPVPPIG